MEHRTHTSPAAADRERAARQQRTATRYQGPVRVGATQDPAEREADRAASAILSGRSATVSPDGVVRRVATVAGAAFDAPSGAAHALAGSRGSGGPLPAGLRSAAERSLGVDLSAVRVHSGPRSHALAATLSAQALTSGDDIHVGRDAPALHTPAGQRVLAHELGHVAQHRAGAPADLVRRLPSPFTKKKKVPAAPKKVAATAAQDTTGRRTVLQAQAGPGTAVRFVKVSIAGSGGQYWKTDKKRADEGKDLGQKFDKKVDGTTGVGPTSYRKKLEPDGPEVVFSGPGGAGTRKSRLEGARDSGSNKIAELVRAVPPMVYALVDAEQKAFPGAKVVVLFRAHSRGAVALSKIIQLVGATYAAAPDVELEAVLFDPVMGPNQAKGLKKVDLGHLTDGAAPLVNATLVHSVASTYGHLAHSFTPERVLGTKRIIITSAGHDVDIAKGGFEFAGKKYGGSGLGSLPEGVFVQTRRGAELVKVADMTDARRKVKQAYGNKDALLPDVNRMAVLDKVIRDYYARGGT